MKNIAQLSGFLNKIFIVCLYFYHIETGLAQCVPNTRATYNINIAGSTSNGGAFNRSGQLIVTPTITATGIINLNNGQNHRDIGIVSGSPYATPQPGAIHFVTNTALCRDAGTGCGSTPVTAALDIVFTSLSGNQLDISMDGTVYNNSTAGNVLTTNFLNTFTATGWVGSSLYQISSGNMNLVFENSGQTVRGSIDIIGGSGIFGTGTSTYKATITGSCSTSGGCNCSSSNLANLTQQSATITASGANVTYNLGIVNNGNTTANAFKVSYYLATDRTATATRYIVGTDNIGALASGATTNISKTINVCNTTGISSQNYYLGYTIDVDNTVSESNENDNSFITINSQAISCPTPQYRIEPVASPSIGGSVTGTGYYNSGQTVNVTASPATGWRFVNWTENWNIVSNNSSYSFIASSNRTLVANFSQVLPCNTPMNLTLSRTCGTCVDLKWDAVANADSFEIRARSINSSNWFTTRITAERLHRYCYLAPNERREFQVRAKCRADYSDWSASKFSDTLMMTQSPYCASYGYLPIYINDVKIGNRAVLTTGDNCGIYYNRGPNLFNTYPNATESITATMASSLYSFANLQENKIFWRAWIDWNQDNNFSDSEIILKQDSVTPYRVNNNFVVPSNAKLGKTRMRIRVHYRYFGLENPCSNGGFFGESEDYDLTILAPNTVDDLAAIGISIYPNPTTDKIQITSKNDPFTEGVLELTNLLGKVVKRQMIPNSSSTSIEIDVSDMPKGVYVLQMKRTEGIYFSTKIIKN